MSVATSRLKANNLATEAMFSKAEFQLLEWNMDWNDGMDYRMRKKYLKPFPEPEKTV